MKSLNLVRIILLLTFGLSLSVLPVFSQARSADEDLGFFPKGRYLTISHFDVEAIKKSKEFSFYQQNFILGEPGISEEEQKQKGEVLFVRMDVSAPTLDYRRFPLPEIMLTDISNVTIGQVIRLDTVDEIQDSPVQAVTLEDKNGNEKPKVGIFISSDQVISVFEFPDVQLQLAQAMEKNQLEDTGKKLFGRPVFSFARKGHLKGKDLFAWASPDNKLIVSNEIVTLKNMILSRRGKIPSLVDNEDYIDLIAVYGDLGPAWFLSSPRQSTKEIVETLESEQLDDEQIDSLTQRAQEQAFFTISSIYLDKPVLVKSWEIFETSEAAAEKISSKQNTSAGLSGLSISAPEFDQYQAELDRRKRTVLMDNVIVTSITYDKELFALREKANQAMAKAIQANNGQITMTTGDGKSMKFIIKQESSGKTKKK